MEGVVLVAEPDAQLPEALAVRAFLQGEAPHLAIGVGAGLDPLLQQMLASDEQDPPLGKQDRPARRGEGGTYLLAGNEDGMEVPHIGGGGLLDVENSHGGKDGAQRPSRQSPIRLW